jgi:ferritin-like metal-binding protein YciE
MTTEMNDPRELFLHELGDVLYAERSLVKTLPKLQDEASDEELAVGFEEHLDQTRQHVKNVEQAFKKLGEKPTAEKCPGIEGIKKEHDEFVANESPSQDVLDAFLTGAGARTEHYEIAAYESLVTMAEALGETEVVELLTENLEQEQTALEKLKTIGKRLAEQGAKQKTPASPRRRGGGTTPPAAPQSQPVHSYRPRGQRPHLKQSRMRRLALLPEGRLKARKSHRRVQRARRGAKANGFDYGASLLTPASGESLAAARRRSAPKPPRNTWDTQAGADS